jgi:primosomal protein N' (replication factor Y) (superfamily II helicase)
MTTPHFILVSPLEAASVEHFAYTYQSTTLPGKGQIVRIPFGKSRGFGVVIAPTGKPQFATRPIEEMLDIRLPEQLVDLAAWLSDYYSASPKSVWQTMLPSGLTVKRRPSKDVYQYPDLPDSKDPLSPDQAAAIEGIWQSSAQSHLIWGITGSGKTRLYLELAEKSLKTGRSVIVLVPEIALTPQIIGRFRARFFEQVVHTNSMMTPSQRHLVWQQALSEQRPLVVIGPRSALFLPLANLGMIILDESHETSYKQEQSPRYQADATAARLARLHHAKLVMGSATPSLNQIWLAEQQRIQLAELRTRPSGQALPVAEVIDLRDKSLLRKSRFISLPLIEALERTLAEGRQSLLFINRRGSASSQLCSDCGFVSRCPACQLPLTFHADSLKLICHVCNHQSAPPAICPDCGHNAMRFIGGGTKRIEAETLALFPTARIRRLDRDSASAEVVREIDKRLRSGHIDILIGTQMIAKGLDLPTLDTVGVVSADTMLYLPDFTASERTYQLLSQVSGRAGRGDMPGRVLIQTYTPEHPAIQAAAHGDSHGFVAQELAQRQLLGYPPYSYLLKLTTSAKTSAAAEKRSLELATKLQGQNLSLLGPAPAFRGQSSGQFHWQIVVKSHNRRNLLSVARSLPSAWTVDLDPINLL